MNINPEIFKSYDIRGVYKKDFDDDTAYKIGRAFVEFLKAKKVIVGSDMRLSSPALRQALIAGITDQGANVLDIGFVSSDMFYFACGNTGLPGLTVTASHNPPEYNGFKMVKKMPEFISGGNGMEEFKEAVMAANFSTPSDRGQVEAMDIKKDYKEKVLSLVDVSKIRNKKVVVDAANGMGGVAFDLAYENLPIEVVKMYFKPDGTFPNHGGDPLLEENRKDLVAKVLQQKADIGFAFDPDADRVFVIDDRGKFVSGDFLTALLGKYLIDKKGGGNIVYDLRASWAVRDLITEAGGKVFENKVGHAHIKPRMQKENAIFGGEVTGHYYFADFFFADSGVIPSLLVLEMLETYGKKMSELVKPLEQKYFISGEYNFKVSDADQTLAKIKDVYKKDFEITEMDGISVIASNWHANIRKSNTEPLVRLNMEAKSKDLMEQKKKEIVNLIGS